MRRRRFLCLVAASLAAGPAHVPVTRMRFRAMGAEAVLVLPGADGRHALEAVRAEIERVEAAVSLWRPDSELRRLNRSGDLVPSVLFRELFDEARTVSALTGGGFDVTVQPLWEGRVAPMGWRDFAAEGFHRAGMAATFNGIAQGFAADRAVAVLDGLGYRDVLVNLGEWRGMGRHPSGRPWAVGVADPLGRSRMVLSPGAIATSEPRGTLVRGAAHIFDPLGRPGPRWSSVTVRARTAARADAVSTAVTAAPVAEADAILRATGAMEAVLIDAGGRLRRWRA